MIIRIILLFCAFLTTSHTISFAFDKQEERKTHISFLKPSKSLNSRSLIHKTYGQHHLEKDTENSLTDDYSGYLWSHGQFLLGLEGNLTSSSDNPNNFIPYNLHNDDKHINRLQGKAGFLLNNNFLLYATVGIITVDSEADGSSDQYGDQLLWGWTAGAGIEFSSQDGIRFGFDALYVGFEDELDKHNTSPSGNFNKGNNDKDIMGRARIIVPLK